MVTTRNKPAAVPASTHAPIKSKRKANDVKKQTNNKSKQRSTKKRVIAEEVVPEHTPKQFILEKKLQKKVNAGIMAAARKYGVEIHGRTVFYFNYHGLYHGNKKLAESTKKTYECLLSQYWRFLAEIGDFESMLPLVSLKRLHNVPAMKVESLTAMMRCKKMEKGTILRANDESSAIRHVLTNAVLKCTSSWKNNKTLDQFQSAIALVHKTHDHVLPYMEVCKECTKKNKKISGSACLRHSGRNPHLFRSGNPTRTVAFANIKEAVRDNSYLETGCDPMDPSHIRLVRERLTRSKSTMDLGRYALILIACRLFLRADEIIKFKV